jgi:ATP-dependent Clp protease adaptor protein ClpS
MMMRNSTSNRDESAPDSAPQQEGKTAVLHEPSWKVVVLNDPVNLMSYVVVIFKRVFGYSHEKARNHMLEVHHKGRSVLWQGDRERAEMYVYTLQQWQLTAILEHDA